jgi:transcriptional regulator with XRE-family HTH domain
MILKKLRAEKTWSQEQVATFSGLSTRTIQRIESGQSASLETLKALASVFEVDTSKLTEEIKVIDKTTEKWQSLPLYVRFIFADSNIPIIGPGNRKNYLKYEAVFAFGGIILYCLGFILPVFGNVGLILLLIAYLTAVAIRLGDKYEIW